MHEMQAAGAKTILNGWDQDVDPDMPEQSTGSMRSSRHAGKICFVRFWPQDMPL